MTGAPWLIDIERVVLRDPEFTAQRAERIRLALGAELKRRVQTDAEIEDRSVATLEVPGIDIRPSDDDDVIAHHLALSILEAAGLAREGDHG